jgi:tRNA modification GTPase
VEYQSSHRGTGALEAVSARTASAAQCDTIVAAATPAGYGGIAIVRVSGPAVPLIAAQLLGALPAPRLATRASFRARDAHAIDTGLALYFPAPHSYTGEHVLELQGHGGPVVVEALIARALELGARRAQPGEFTQRAYLNGKLDLTQAEAVADLINAASEASARAALRSLEGEFSGRVRALGERLRELRAHVEAAIDFAHEEIDVLADGALAERLTGAAHELAGLRKAGVQGRLITEGITLVIAGRPNSGKSSLLNRLAGTDAAIVTAIPGTTRDVLRERIHIEGMPVHILDTAGLRELPGDAIEAEGIRRAQAAMAKADRILFVIDSLADPMAGAYLAERARLPAAVPVTLVFNKIDLIAPGTDLGAPVSDAVRISARTGEGLEQLRSHLKACAGLEAREEGSAISARARHLEALERSAMHLQAAMQQLAQRRARELVAEELRCAQLALEQIIGAESSDELLGRIFASFCIGK